MSTRLRACMVTAVLASPMLGALAAAPANAVDGDNAPGRELLALAAELEYPGGSTGRGHAHPTLHMQMVDLARLPVSVGSGAKHRLPGPDARYYSRLFPKGQTLASRCRPRPAGGPAGACAVAHKWPSSSGAGRSLSTARDHPTSSVGVIASRGMGSCPGGHPGDSFRSRVVARRAIA
jgi:hypothetical protein